MLVFVAVLQANCPPGALLKTLPAAATFVPATTGATSAVKSIEAMAIAIPIRFTVISTPLSKIPCQIVAGYFFSRVINYF